MNYRFRIYRTFQSILTGRLVVSRFFSEARKLEEANHNISRQCFSDKTKDRKRFWFHAASVGELEAMWTVIASLAEQDLDLVLTVFSESARGQLEKLAAEISKKKATILYFGYSPCEGRWSEAIELINPDCFVTAKYEAWPELWAFLSAQKIPLIIIGATARRSLRVAKVICGLLGCQLPNIKFLITRENDGLGLKDIFPHAATVVTGDPRWDRVQGRNSRGNLRAKQLIDHFMNAKRPWGVLGSVWLEDLEIWGPLLKKIDGFLWLVPHKINNANINQIIEFVEQLGLKTGRSSDLSALCDSASLDLIVVNEMGFLSELYQSADWAYIGGGFSYGVHSTIEPAIHGIPIAAGPKRALRFPEVPELLETGQLTLIENREDLSVWISKIQSLRAMSGEWRKQASERLGGTDRVLAQL